METKNDKHEENLTEQDIWRGGYFAGVLTSIGVAIIIFLILGKDALIVLF